MDICMDINLFDEIRKDVQKMIQNDDMTDRQDLASAILSNLDFLQYRVIDCEMDRVTYKSKYIKERLAHKNRFEEVGE